MYSSPTRSVHHITHCRTCGKLNCTHQFSNTLSSSSELSTIDKKSLDFTQRIEKKLTEYNASKNFLKRWLFELLSCLLSTLCMVAIVAIYVYLKDQPISRAGNLLTYANILGKVASAALIVPISEALGQLKWNWFHNSRAMWDFEIFDKASRGPLGAVMLLFRTKGRSLAALGALLIVLLLAIDTFFQQVVDLPTRWDLSEIPSLLPRAVWYAPDLAKIYREGAEMNVLVNEITLILDNFAYGNGTQPIPFGNGTRPDIPLTCPTSNCTWAAYDTLGVCSQCTDVSNLLQYACLNSTVDWTVNLNGGYGITYPKGRSCGYFLNATSQNPILMSGYILDKNNTIGETLTLRTLPLTTVYDYIPLYGNGSIHFKTLRNTIADVLIVSAADGSAASVHRRRMPVAQECVLSWCVKTMQSTYFSGTYREEVLSTYHNMTQGSNPWKSEPFQTEYQNGTDNLYLEDILIKSRNTSGLSDGEYFGTSNWTSSSVIQGFHDIFPASTTWNSSNGSELMRYKSWARGPAWQRSLKFNPWLAPNDVSKHMDRLASAMTNAIRSAPSRIMLKGSSYNRETYIRVRWPWLSFPFLLLILSLLFLTMTIIKTSGDGTVGIWKTSAMPTLIYGLPKETQSRFASPSTWKAEPRKTRIRLMPDRGWRVSGQSHLSRSPI